MQQEIANKIIECAYDTGRWSDDDISLYEDYSGRAMYGETTAGIVVSREIGVAGLIAIVLQFADQFVNDDGMPLFEDVSKLRTDNMGMDTIVY